MMIRFIWLTVLSKMTQRGVTLYPEKRANNVPRLTKNSTLNLWRCSRTHRRRLKEVTELRDKIRPAMSEPVQSAETALNIEGKVT